MNVYQRLGVPGVINAAGKLTALGGTAQSEAVARAQAEAARGHVELARLRARAGELIAERCSAEAASVTAGAAAGIAISVAACVAGTDRGRVERLPDSEGWTNAVLIQARHWIDFGAPVEQMVRLGGGRPRRFGAAAAVTAADLDAALSQPVAALCYVQSHHTMHESGLALDLCISVCHRRRVPVIVDAAAEEDLRRYVGMGADLVTYSGGKAPGGPTVGFIAGRRDLIEACEMQTRGIARPMKVGKEQIVGLLVALEEYASADPRAERERRARVNSIIEGALDDVPDVRVEPTSSEAERVIERIAVSAADDAFDVGELVRFLESSKPSIRTRNTHLADGIVLFDPREVTEAQAKQIAARLRVFFNRDSGDELTGQAST